MAKEHAARSFAAILIASIAATSLSQTAAAGPPEASVARGGRLYDNWYRETKNRAPTIPHPSYWDPQTTDARAESWRCKTCHGWDYGGPSSRPQATGIKRLAGASIGSIRAVLIDATHRYDAVLAARDLTDLAAFVSAGQIDMMTVIDVKTGKSQGSASEGAPFYTSICTNCHGLDGQKLHTMPVLGEVARELVPENRTGC